MTQYYYKLGELKQKVSLNKEVLECFDGLEDDQPVDIFLVLTLTAAFGTGKQLADMIELSNGAINSIPDDNIELNHALIFNLAVMSFDERAKKLSRENLRKLVKELYRPEHV